MLPFQSDRRIGFVRLAGIGFGGEVGGAGDARKGPDRSAAHKGRGIIEAIAARRP